MNYGNRKSMYEDSKTSLKKFIGEQLSSEKQSSEIKLRKLVKNEVLVATGTFKEQKKQLGSCYKGDIGGSRGGWKMSQRCFIVGGKIDWMQRVKLWGVILVALSDIY